MRALGLLPLSLYIVSLLARASFAGEISLLVFPESRAVFQGGVVVISVSGKGLAGVRAFHRDREVPIFPTGESGSYICSKTGLGYDAGRKRSRPCSVIKVLRIASGTRSINILCPCLLRICIIGGIRLFAMI